MQIGVIYARYSSHSQTEQSIEGQLKICYEYAKENNIQIIHEYIDRAHTGTESEHRYNFQKMIKDSNKKRFDVILMYKFDRFMRDVDDIGIYKKQLKKNNVKLISATEPIPDDPSGIIIEYLHHSMSTYYSAELSQKISRGMDINAEKHLTTGGNLALGFTTNEHKEIIIDEKTAPCIKEIFNMYILGSSMADITRYLNSQGIKTSRGNEFNKNSIHRILTNERYIGTYTYKDKKWENAIPAIIDKALFDKAQAIIEKRKKAPARAKAVEEQYYLTGKLFCGYCGSTMSGKSGTSKTKRKHFYYRCKNHIEKSGCDFLGVKKYEIEEIVIKKSRDFIMQPGVINTIADEIIKLFKSDQDSSNLTALKKRLKETMKAQENLLVALENGSIADILVPRIEEKAKEINIIKQNIAKEELLFESLEKDEIIFFLEGVANGDINEPEVKQAFVDVFINKIFLWEDKMDITYNVCDVHSEITLDFLQSSSKGRLVEATGVEPVSEK